MPRRFSPRRKPTGLLENRPTGPPYHQRRLSAAGTASDQLAARLQLAFRRDFGLALPDWRTGLADCLADARF
jgi:hypothetical protein